MRLRTRLAAGAVALAALSTPSVAVVIETARGNLPSPTPATLVSPDQQVGVVGQDNWVFYGDLFQNNYSQALGSRIYSEPELEAFIAALNGQWEWLARRGIPLVFGVMPAKWEIYRDKLPESGSGKSILDQVVAAQGRIKAPVPDFRPTLSDGRENADTYSKLNGHWSDYGGYLAWGQLASVLEAANPSVAVAPYPGVSSIKTIDSGNEFVDLLGFPGPNNWTVPELDEELPAVDVIAPDGTTQRLAPGAQTDMSEFPRHTQNPASANSSTVLAMCDSTCRAISPFLQSSFRDVFQIQHSLGSPYGRPNIPALVTTIQPDLVLYMMTQRYFDLGLNDAAFWAAANKFDLASTILLDAAEVPAAVAGVVELPPVTPTGESVVVSVSLDAAAAGIVTLSSSGASVDLLISPGKSVLFAELSVEPGEAVSLTVRPAAETGAVVSSAMVKSAAE